MPDGPSSRSLLAARAARSSSIDERERRAPGQRVADVPNDRLGGDALPVRSDRIGMRCGASLHDPARSSVGLSRVICTCVWPLAVVDVDVQQLRACKIREVDGVEPGDSVSGACR